MVIEPAPEEQHPPRQAPGPAKERRDVSAVVGRRRLERHGGVRDKRDTPAKAVPHRRGIAGDSGAFEPSIRRPHVRLDPRYGDRLQMRRRRWEIGVAPLEPGAVRWNRSGAIARQPILAKRSVTSRMCGLTPNASWNTSSPRAGGWPSGRATQARMLVSSSTFRSTQAEFIESPIDLRPRQQSTRGRKSVISPLHRRRRSRDVPPSPLRERR